MASRNVKTGTSTPVAGPSFDPTDKLQSNTLKRHPKMDLNKSDLLRLLSYLEGELQGRDIVIATLKAEKAKQLLYQAKYGRFGLGDPFMALQRDSDNLKDNTFDEMAIKSMYDNQLAQLENLIATQRKAQMKMREQLAVGEKKYHKACSELDDEKRKHAQDTAQGDDVTYMLEKERERLRQEIDFEKSQNKKTEKELKKCLVSIEEEKANAAKHKQVALLLIKERKKLIEKILQERQKCSQMELILSDEKGKTKNMAEGLVQESTKSLKMEAAMEKQLNEFDVEREQLKNRLSKEEIKNHDLQTQVESLQQQVEYLKKHASKTAQRDYLQSIEIKSSASPLKQTSKDRSVENVQTVSVPAVSSAKQTHLSRPADVADQTRHTTRENATMSPVKLYASSPASPEKLVSSFATAIQRDGRVSPAYFSQIDKTVNVQPQPSPRSSGMSPSTAVITSGGGKISLQVSQSVSSPRKQISIGRGAPPPVPPNKPNLSSSPVPGQKPTPPPKVGITISKDKITVSSSENLSSEGSAGRSPRAIQIPVSVVNSSSSPSGSRTPSRDSSPMRKTQVCVNAK